MTEESKDAVLSLEAALDLANQTDAAVERFLSTLRDAELGSVFDALSLSLVLQERVTFGDVRILVDNGRLFGAQARLRSMWESLVTLRYVCACAPDREEASNAFLLYDEY